ncbi:MAG: DUF4956 domain-containing protein [Oscillospiraceae bacterium]|nr:DUF4956 domain-containing protein [Oscillospiraceae bacterium]
MFDSIYSAVVTPAQFFAMAAAALVSGFVYSWIMSFRVRSTKRFFIVSAMIPFVVSAVITFVNGNIGAGVAIGGAFGLIRFRSAQGSADEIAAILVSMGSGIAFGMGYVVYGVIILIAMALIFTLLSHVSIFDHRERSEERLLRITVPETLEYDGVFDDAFARYLKSAESAGVKTTAMGSMFRLSYRIQMKDPAEEKAFIDELRVRNGNLEISILPYAEQANKL